MKMADLILANNEEIAKFTKINSLQNYPLYGNIKSAILFWSQPSMNSAICNFDKFGKLNSHQHLILLDIKCN